MTEFSRSDWIAYALRDGANLRRALERQASTLEKASSLLCESIRGGGKILLFGNGGSAADAQHIAAEFVGRLTIDRPPIAAIALTVDSSALTAIGNDYGYDLVFERQVRALGRAGDVAVAISTSGKSPSIVRATAAAREIGMRVIGLTGSRGAEFAAQCDIGIAVPSTDTARIQEAHITIGHLLCALVEAELCDVPLVGAPPPRHAASKFVTLDALLPLREAYRAQGRSVVWTNGCFDVLHAGHVTSLGAARALGDVLIVGLNDDDQVRRAKGEGRPIHGLAQRATMLGALEVVDHVVAFSEPTPSEVLARLKPDIHCKGADYAPPDGPPIPEADVVRAYGGRLEFLPFVDGLSTTSIVRSLSSAAGK